MLLWVRMNDSFTGSNISRTRFFTEKIQASLMESCSSDNSNREICWFCKKGRHEECMKEIPIDGKSEGPHDFTFDTKMITCKCKH